MTSLALLLSLVAGALAFVIDGKSVPVTVEPELASLLDERAPPNPVAPPGLPALGPRDSIGAVTRAGDETLVRSWRHRTDETRSELFRIAPDGAVRRFVLPVNDRGSRDSVCGRALVVALESRGTLVWDLESNRAVGFVAGIGRFGNAPVAPPARSPDNRFVAIATPYGRAVTVVRLTDAAVVGSVTVEGPSVVRWSRAGISVKRTALPYER